MIREDDGYRRTRYPEPDDLAIYMDREGELLHVARIVELREGVTKESPRIPYAVSKWADWTGEVLHSVYDHPYDETCEPEIQYWTDWAPQGEGRTT